MHPIDNDNQSTIEIYAGENETLVWDNSIKSE